MGESETLFKLKEIGDAKMLKVMEKGQNKCL